MSASGHEAACQITIGRRDGSVKIVFENERTRPSAEYHPASRTSRLPRNGSMVARFAVAWRWPARSPANTNPARKTTGHDKMHAAHSMSLALGSSLVNLAATCLCRTVRSANPASARRRRSSPFLLIAAALLIFAAIAGAAFLLSRPTTLRIAVGPPGSDDQKLIQSLAQTFINEGSPVRLTVISTAGPVESLGLLTTGETDLAVGRADEDMPKGAGSVAILRKNVVVLWAPSGAPRKGGKKESQIEDQGDRRSRRSPHRRDRPHPGQCHAAQGDPERIRRQSRQGHDFALLHLADHRHGEGPLDRRVHDGRPARQQDHDRRHHHDRAAARRADVHSDRRLGSARAQTSAL